MGVQLNIKDEETVRLAKRLAADLGESLTETIRHSLEERAARIAKTRQKPSLEELKAIVRDAQQHIKPEFRGREMSIEHADLLYDEDGSFR